MARHNLQEAPACQERGRLWGCDPASRTHASVRAKVVQEIAPAASLRHCATSPPREPHALDHRNHSQHGKQTLPSTRTLSPTLATAPVPPSLEQALPEVSLAVHWGTRLLLSWATSSREMSSRGSSPSGRRYSDASTLYCSRTAPEEPSACTSTSNLQQQAWQSRLSRLAVAGSADSRGGLSRLAAAGTAGSAGLSQQAQLAGRGRLSWLSLPR
jgi:hypothetical protein